MNQRTHAWIAIRAAALLDDEQDRSGIATILKQFIKSAAVGAWFPDRRDTKIGGADTDNHVLKMEPYKGPQQERFTLAKTELLKKLGTARKMYSFLEQDKVLDDAWWARAYKANPQPGQHIADRVGALTTTITDLLIMGDDDLAKILPNKYSFAKELDDKCRTRSEQAAMYLFMQSHFVADACMPCHCDARKLSSYANGLHKELESHWSQKVGTYFDDQHLEATNNTPEAILKKAKEVDQTFGLNFSNAVPNLVEQDVWLEIIYICRGSFAIASIIAPSDQYAYHTKTFAPFAQVLDSRPDLLAELDRVTMHDAVLNVAITWKHLWSRLNTKQ